MKKFISCFITLLILTGTVLASDLTKDQARMYREEAYRLQNSGSVDEAYSLYMKAAAMDPSYVEVYNDIGVILEMKGDLNGAEDMYLKVIEQDNSFLSAYANLGFLYEKKRDREKAGYYWRKRYELGTEGEYWWQVAKQHLIDLGTWEDLMREIQEKKAMKLSQELVYKREQVRLKIIEEAQMHFKLGTDVMARGDFTAARKEFNTVLALNPSDDALKAQAAKYYKDSLLNELTQKIGIQLDKSKSYLKEKDYLSLMSELQKSLEMVSEIPADQLVVNK